MDQNTIEQIKILTEQGFSARRLTQKLNLDFEEIRVVIRSNNFSMIKRQFDQSKIEEITELYIKGVSAKNLGIIFGISKSKVMAWAKEQGKLRSREEAGRIHNVNEYIFENLNTPEQAYWLGFLYADAYNNENGGSVTLALKEGDKGHVIKFIEFMGGDIKSLKYTKNKLGNSWKYNINSRYLCQKLYDLGCPQAKSFIIKYPYWLQQDLHQHFIRGIFDGDGSLSFKKNNREWHFSIAGTKELCEGIKEWFNKHKLDTHISYISKTGNNTYELASSGNRKNANILDILYKNSTAHLDRKYNLYLELKDFNAKRDSRLFSKIISINGQEINTKYIRSLSLYDKKILSDQLVDYFYQVGFIYPDDHEKIIREYAKLCLEKIDINQIILNNQSSLGTYICKYFCNSFYQTSSQSSTSIVNSYTKEKLKTAIDYKLGIFKTNETSTNFSHQTIVDTLRDTRSSAKISMFKPIIAKYICLKYSEEGDIVGDYSCGFGGRMLGAVSCGRKYVGTDPLTTPELQKMADNFKLKDVKLINDGSEYYKGEENSIDLYWSSPPYYDLEVYSSSLNQANSKGKNHFYNVYWRETLKNVKRMLKPNKWFGVNVNDAHYDMVSIAKEYFGEIKEEVILRSNRQHFAGNKIKDEKIFMFLNNK